MAAASGRLIRALVRLVQVPASAQALLKGVASAHSCLEVMRRVPTIDAFSDTGVIPDEVQGRLEVLDVTFAYPASPDQITLSRCSLTIPANTSCALCGPSGSGKSTLIALLERFYDPQGGAITLDGVDLRSLQLGWLRMQIGMVGQEPVLFQGSVADNIRYGKAGASQDEVEEAATLANAHTFISETLAQSYRTEVGLHGGRLSGGQKQRVALARALVRRPAVLLLDEATSALDNESEKVVQAALDELMKQHQRTTITIAHRLSTIRDANQIAVVNRGVVVETGTHDELRNQRGLYAELLWANAER